MAMTCFIPFIASFKIWNAGVSVITRSTFSSLRFVDLDQSEVIYVLLLPKFNLLENIAAVL
jgi:hypothetical protein